MGLETGVIQSENLPGSFSSLSPHEPSCPRKSLSPLFPRPSLYFKKIPSAPIRPSWRRHLQTPLMLPAITTAGTTADQLVDVPRAQLVLDPSTSYSIRPISAKVAGGSWPGALPSSSWPDQQRTSCRHRSCRWRSPRRPEARPPTDRASRAQLLLATSTSRCDRRAPATNAGSCVINRKPT